MSFSRIINKTPLKNELTNVYEIDSFSLDTLKRILQSRFISEGVYTIEKLQISGTSEHYLSTPSFDKMYNFQQTSKEWLFNQSDIKELEVIELALSKPSFMPLDINQHINLLKKLDEFTHSPILTQILISKRQDNWRESTINMYEDYRNGNDFPAESQTMRKIQNKFLGVLNKVGNFEMERDSIPEMEKKILQPNYRIEIRIVIFYRKYLQQFKDFLLKNLKNLTFFNELVALKGNKKEICKFIQFREFKTSTSSHLLSDQEISSILLNQPIESSKEINISKIKQASSNIPDPDDTLYKAIQLMPYQTKEEKEVDASIANTINKAFQRVGIVKKPLKVNEVYQGSVLLKVQLQVPPDIMYTTITKKLTDIQAALGNENISIEIGDKPDTINIYAPLENRDAVYFRGVLESSEFQSYVKNNPLPFIIGEKARGGFEFGCLSKLRHLLIAGATGSGKSVFINLIIISLLLNVSPNELDLYLIDPKMVEFSQFKGFPQVKQIETNMKNANNLVYSLVNEMEKRYKKLKDAGVKNIEGYNKKFDVKLPYIVCVIDEYADLMAVKPEVEENVVRLGQKARAAGIHLIISTQKPLNDVVTSLLKSNLPSAISFRLKTSSDYRTVFGKGINCTLLGKGDGVAMIEGQEKEFERFQAPILTLDESEEEEIYKQLKQLFNDVKVSHEELEEIIEEDPIDKLKRIIANSRETRVSTLRELMGIKMDLHQDLMRQLVDEGWLELKNRKYSLIVDEEELNKWKDN
jgi:DNA segregation ATPase FtsK/SpoIIIE, S-DNA-T family